MITKEEFDEVQAILGRRGKPRAQIHHFSFTGLIKCGECGSSITAQINSKRLSDGTIKYYIYYHCSKRKKGVKCSQKSIEESKITDVVKNELNSFTIPQLFEDWAIEYLNELNDSEVGDRQLVYGNVEKKYSDCQKFLDKLTKAYYRELIDEDEFIKQKDELMAEKRKLKLQLDNIEHRSNHWLESSLEIFSFAKNAREIFETTDDWRVRKQIAGQLGSNFVLKDGVLTLDRLEPLTVLVRGLERMKSKYPRFKPDEFGVLTGSKFEKTEDFTSVRSFWRDSQV